MEEFLVREDIEIFGQISMDIPQMSKMQIGKKADGKLSNDLSIAHGDNKRGQGTPNNFARKWFRDKRPK